jgi:cellulose synthase/poly-beta-1,6-N-acetylglucosamine synthase-like glycosyltransferase
MTAIVVVALVVVVWTYVGYPLVVGLIARLRPRPRRRASIDANVSVIIAAHDEASIIGAKVANTLASRGLQRALEVIVASDGSSDATVAAATAAGATAVLDLPRAGKLTTLNAAVEASHGDVLVFTDADSRCEPGTIAALVSNFADDEVGAVAGYEVHVNEAGDAPIGRGEGLYWRYEQAIKRWEDRAGSTVSASGRLYAIRRDVFIPSDARASTDDFVISTQAIRAGRRLALDENARVFVPAPREGGTELRRKIRVMNRGLRGALALAALLARHPTERPGYLLQLLFHKILRRTVGFFLVALLVANAFLVRDDPRWWFLLAPQLALYMLALIGAYAQQRRARAPKLCWVAYYFCLATLAAACAVCSLVRGTRYEVWEPTLARGSGTRVAHPEVAS